MKNGRLQCKDIPTEPVLEFIGARDGRWCTWFGADASGAWFENSVRRAMPTEVPDGLAVAKMAGLIARGLVDGCSCGCRGDYTLTKRGREAIGLDRGPRGLEVS